MNSSMLKGKVVLYYLFFCGFSDVVKWALISYFGGVKRSNFSVILVKLSMLAKAIVSHPQGFLGSLGFN